MVIRHKSPLHNLMQIFKLKPKSISKIAIAICNPLEANRIPLQTSIANSKEDSILKANSATEAIKVYLDRSENNGKVGAAATLIRAGQLACTLYYHLGSDAEHTVITPTLSVHVEESLRVALSPEVTVPPVSDVIRHCLKWEKVYANLIRRCVCENLSEVSAVPRCWPQSCALSRK